MPAFLWWILLVYARLVSTADLTRHAGSQGKSIFLLAGQSNMSGRGGVVNHGQGGVANETWDGVIPPQCQSHPSILSLSPRLTWVEAKEPLHKGIDLNKTLGVSPGMAFANSLRERDPAIGVIGLVPCASGGTNISEWARGTELYNQMMRRGRAALRGGGEIRALLWYQGESDAITYEDARLYKGRLKRFFTHVRADLNLPTLPIIQVALATALGPYIDVVRKAQLELKLPNLRCVDAKGLPLQPDHVHISTPAQVQLGTMLADAFLQTQPYPVQSNASKRYHNFVSDFFQRHSR